MKYRIIVLALATIWFDLAIASDKTNLSTKESEFWNFHHRSNELFRGSLNTYKQSNPEYNWDKLLEKAKEKRGTSNKVPEEYVKALDHALSIKRDIAQLAETAIKKANQELKFDTRAKSYYISLIEKDLMLLALILSETT